MSTMAQVDEILDRLRHDGGRVTTVRRAVVAALLESPAYVTAELLGDAVHARHPEVHQSTIYRILDDLERIGVIDHFYAGPGPAIYHVVGPAHHHLVCDRCHAVTELPSEAFAELGRHLETRSPVSIPARHLSVIGRCAACGDDT